MDDSFFSSLPKSNWWGDDNLYQWNDFWFRPQYLQGTLKLVEQFKPLDSDVILASFPKTGTTWLKALLYSIINRSSRDSLQDNHPHLLIPTLEIQLFGPLSQSQYPTSSFSAADDSNSSRILATHLPYQILAQTIASSNCRVVSVTRNPKDTLVSLWHFIQNSKDNQGTWPLEVAVENFCNGTVPYGPYYDHVLGYKKASLEKPKNVYFISYEELKGDTRTHVKSLAEFIGYPFEGDGEEKVLDEIIKNCSFKTLSNYEVNKCEKLNPWLKLPYNSFYRQGEIGDHKNYLNQEMIDRIDKVTREKFGESEFEYGI
ncbi:hypothetical protein ACFE04_006623 [Oxalis oulophora]